MPLPSVTINISDDSFLVEDSDTTSESFLAGFIVENLELINALGTTADVTNKFFETDSSDLYERLSSPIGNGAGVSFAGFGGSAGTSGALYPSVLEGGSGVTAGQIRWPKGAVYPWADDFNNAMSAAVYGTKLVIGISASNPFTSSNSHDLDAIFGTGLSADEYMDTIMTNRENDCFAVRGITAVDSGAPTGDEFDIFVYGDKYSLPLGKDPESISNDAEYNQTRLTSDVIGCLARTFRVAHPWFSPAGMNRGQIKNVVKLKDPPTATQASSLYDNKINPVLSFPGEGVVLFGNKTGAASTSLLSKIEISSLFIYLKKKIGAVARKVLFEQNTDATRQSFLNQASSILEKVQSKGGISEFTIKCDETNNPSAIVTEGKFVASIFVKPARCIETLEITFTNKNDGETLV
tara:strand:+ start:4673 stop:5896 length:1224 start_codon:yes stop_codon:yes gene_type:complete